MAPLSPTPTDETGPPVLVCTTCGSAPRSTARSRALNQVIHTAVVNREDDQEEICGGTVVPVGEEWRAVLQPGVVVPCAPLKRVGAHLVRLGRVANRRNQSWTGTALCGLVQSGSQHWIPLAPTVAERMKVCRRCDEARESGAAA